MVLNDEGSSELDEEARRAVARGATRPTDKVGQKALEDLAKQANTNMDSMCRTIANVQWL